MSSSLTIHQARLVLPHRVVTGDLVVRDGVIHEIRPKTDAPQGESINGEGLVVLPGLVDSYVRLDALDDLGAASGALLAGGITSAVGVREASTGAELDAELQRIATDAALHFGLFVRAGAHVEEALQARRAQGVWVDAELLSSEGVEKVFAEAPGLVCVDHHDASRLRDRWLLFADSDDPLDVPRAHDVDTCVHATHRALELARRHGTRLLLPHVSTAEEVAQLPEEPGRVTAAVQPAHLFHDADAYDRLGKRAVCRPPLRGRRHRDALWEGLRAGKLMMCSGHWPVGGWAKDGALRDVHPGWPSAEWWLPLLVDATHDERCTWLDIARWTSERPAQALGLRRKGRLEAGYDADLVIVDPHAERVIGDSARIHTVAGWSPWQGQALRGWPIHTIVGGRTAWRDGCRHPSRGRELS